MNEEEVQIDLKTLLHYVLRKWRSIVVVMLIFAVAANLYSVKKSMSEVEASSKVEQKIDDKQALEEARDALTEEETDQVDHAFAMHEYNAELYQDNEEYLRGSVLMELNPNEIPTVTLSYQLKKGMTEEDLSDIFIMYETALLDESTCTAIAEVFGDAYSNTIVRELVDITDATNQKQSNTIKMQSTDSGILNIQIYATDKKQCERIAEIVKSRLQEYTQQLQQIFGEYVINLVTEQYYVSGNSDLNTQKADAINAVSNAYSAMQSASSGLNESQMNYYNLLIKSMEEERMEEASDNSDMVEDRTEVEVSYFSMKFILIGLLAGMFLAACYHAVVYIMTGTVKDVDEVKIVTMLPVFGSVLKSEKHCRYNRVDRWIDSLFNNRKKEDNELLLERIGHEIAMLAEQKNNKHLLLVFQNNEPEMKKQSERLMTKLQECGMDVTGTDGLLTDNTEVLKQLENTDGVVLIEQLMKSDRNQIRDAIELCRRCQAEVLGSVIIGSDCY